MKEKVPVNISKAMDSKIKAKTIKLLPKKVSATMKSVIKIPKNMR